MKTKFPLPYNPLRTGLIHSIYSIDNVLLLFLLLVTCCDVALITSVTFSGHHIFFSRPFFRYIYYFGGLLSGTIKMNSSPLFLHQILIPSLPNFQAGGGQFYTNINVGIIACRVIMAIMNKNVCTLLPFYCCSLSLLCDLQVFVLF